MRNITLLVTTPQGYAERFEKAMQQANGKTKTSIEVLYIPAIAHELSPQHIDMQRLIEHLECYDYLLLSSRKAIDALWESLKQNKKSLPKQVKMCAVGADISYMRERLHTEPAFIPVEPSPMGVVRWLSENGGCKGQRIGVLAPEVIGMEEPPTVPQLLVALQTIGLITDRISAYTTYSCLDSTIRTIITEIKNGRINGIAFTSGGEVQSLMDAIQQVEPSFKFPTDFTLACLGPYTAGCASKLGLTVHLIGDRFDSFEGFAETLYAYF
ncbi:MAG: uroporphyrinogen-III synthase [Bacteroidia bacterium]|nr:uroporphyrinogen-III synthase [Bacteroidia bacterium]